ncbi:SapC family protein [Sphingosinicella sp. YJ22]|uniref:SapC family protein n=1 Tax=Sphingosinicella sp. YJ22 TaxID=1104780 RepID=UPI00140750FC|nr:SapC family protein [Sphingosinicella sp. YJ22]
MATQPPANLPLFYKNLLPLSSQMHEKFVSRSVDKAPYFANAHAVPLTVDEFILAQRFYPIVFSAGDNPVPLGLFGLNEGVNVFVEEDGKLKQDLYVPAYVRRYPWMLAKLRPDSDELSLCFDPDSGLVGEFEDGAALFDGDKPSDSTRQILGFCEDFERAAQRTSAFVREVQEMDLLMEGEVSIQLHESDQPYIYRGFQMVNEEKLRELRGDVVRKINQSGVLGFIFAHLFSLNHVRELFGKQHSLGKVPGREAPAPAPIDA